MTLILNRRTLICLQRYNKGRLLNGRNIDLFANYGHLSLIRYHNDNSIINCTEYAMNWAALWGKFDIVKWLHFNRTEGCTTDAMNNAVRAGNLNIVRFLHENRSEGCTKDAMDYAINRGYFDIVRFLHDNRTEGCTNNALNLMLYFNYIDGIQWLYENRNKNYNIIIFIKWFGHQIVVKWILVCGFAIFLLSILFCIIKVIFLHNIKLTFT
jgi:hypothetical protein